MVRFPMPASVLGAACAVALAAVPAGADQVVAPSLAGAPAAGSSRISLAASLDSCSRGGSAGRSATFRGTMPPMEGASRLQMRFDLFSRPDFGGAWEPVRGVATFGVWKESQPGAPGLEITKQVFLNRGRTYRVAVAFRWVADSGKVVRKASRLSRVCSQPDPRPDLAVSVRSASGNTFVTVRNLGRAVGPFEVGFGSGGRKLATEKLSGLGAGALRALVVRSLPCQPGSIVTVSADPAGVITERSEDNNIAELRCQASG